MLYFYQKRGTGSDASAAATTTATPSTTGTVLGLAILDDEECHYCY